MERRRQRRKTATLADYRRRKRENKRQDNSFEHTVEEEFKVGDVIFEKGDKIRIYPKER